MKINFWKNKITKLGFVIMGVGTLILSTVTLGNLYATYDKKVSEKSAFALKENVKGQTFPVSALCTTAALGSDINAFADTDIDCKRVLSIKDKSELTLLNNIFVKAVPIAPPTKKTILTFNIPSIQTENTTFSQLLFYDENGDLIPASNYNIVHSSGITQVTGSNPLITIDKSSSDATITITFTNPIVISKFTLENLNGNVTLGVLSTGTREAEILYQVDPSRVLDSTHNQFEVDTSKTASGRGPSTIKFTLSPTITKTSNISATELPRYQEIKLFDENNSEISPNDFNFLTRDEEEQTIIDISFSGTPKTITKVQFVGLNGEIKVDTEMKFIVPASQNIEIINNSYTVRENALDPSIKDLDKLEFVTEKYRNLSRLKKITLFNETDDEMGYTVREYDTNYGSWSQGKCESLLECSRALLSYDEKQNGLNLAEPSYFALESFDDIKKISVSANNVKVYVAYVSKSNFNFEGNVDWQEVVVNKIGTTNRSEEIERTNEKELLALKCETALLSLYHWGLESSCDLILQLLPYFNNSLTSLDPIVNLTLKSRSIETYPWWDIQKLEFDANEETSLTLDFDSYESDNESFMSFFTVYFKKFIDKNAETLKKLYIKGPMPSTISVFLSKFTGLKELTIDGAEISNFEFLTTLSNLEKLTIHNTYLSSTEKLLEGSSSYTDIDLSHNIINEISANAFSGLTSLVNLNLSNNMITTLDSSVLPTGPVLKTLNFSNNNLTSIPNLTSLVGLEKVDFGNNMITSVPSGLVSLNSLKTLIVNDNQLTTLPIASTPSNLIKLDIRNNPITYFENDFGLTSAHPNLTSLSIGGATYELNIDANDTKYEELLDYIRTNASRLKELRIENMNLLNSTVTALLTEMANLNSLQLDILSFANNQLQNFNNSTQEVPTSLKELDLSDQNGLSILPSFITKLTNLEKLNLANNSFITIQKIDLPNTLKMVDISGNELTNFQVIKNLKGVEEIRAINIPILQLSSQDYMDLENYFSKNTKLIVSSDSFNARELYAARNFYKIKNFSLYLLDANKEQKKVDFYQQFMLVFESSVIKQLRDQLRIDRITDKEVYDYLDDDKRIFYSRPSVDLMSLKDNFDLDNYLLKAQESLKNIAKDIQIATQKTEIDNAFEQVKSRTISVNNNLIIAVTLVSLILFANVAIIGYVFWKNVKKKKRLEKK